MSFYKRMVAGVDLLMAGIVFEGDGGGGGDFGDDGFNSEGFNAEGFNAEGYNGEGYNGDGYNAEGYNADGYNSEGLDSDGKAKSGGDAGWRDGITDEGHKAIAGRFNSPADAIKAISDLRKLQSTSIRVPGEDAQPEEIAKFNKALGVPDSPEGYEFAMPEGKDATDADKAFQGKLAEIFHKSGINTNAAGKLNELWNVMTAQSEEAQATADKQFVEETKGALQKKWGKDMERNTNLSNRAATYLFGDNFEAASQIEMKDGRFLLDHPVIMEALAKAGVEMDEDGFHRMDPQGAEDLKTEHGELTKQIADAQAAGNSKLANELSEKRNKISQKLHGNSGVVGEGGKTA